MGQRVSPFTDSRVNKRQNAPSAVGIVSLSANRAGRISQGGGGNAPALPLFQRGVLPFQALLANAQQAELFTSRRAAIGHPL